MKTKMVAPIALALLLLGTFATGSMGATVLMQSFDTLSSGSLPGGSGTLMGKHGWKAGITVPDPANLPLLSYPLPAEALSRQGTIELLLVRDNADSIESVFTLLDEQGKMVFEPMLHWKGFARTPVPTLTFLTDGSVNEEAYLSGALSNARRFGVEDLGGLDDSPIAMVAFSKAVKRGQTVHLAFTWGPAPSDCAIYLDGEKLDSTAGDPETLLAIIRSSATLVIGGEPTTSAARVHNMVNSLVLAVRVSDEILAPSTFLTSPRITSVTHDASRVAGYSGFLVEGQQLTVTLDAVAGGQASFDVGDIRDIPLAELADSPGRYTGSYTVKAGDFVDKGAVVGHFRGAGGLAAEPYTAQRSASIDGRVHLAVKPSNELVPADRKAKAGVTIVATDANGKKLRGRQVKLTLSTTDEYTGLVGGGNFADEVGGRVEVNWGGVTDSFGEVTAQYLAGFAAKTVMVNAKDLGSGDIGFGAIRSFIEGKVDITVKEAAVTRLMAMRGTLEVSASRTWLTADGSSRSRITARVLSVDGKPVQGDQVTFTLLGDRGQVRVIQARTDSTGRAFADYIAGTIIGEVQIEVRDVTLGLTAVVPIELRADAPAEVTLRAEAPEVFVGGKGTAILARVTDANGNPNGNTDIQFALVAGSGTLSVEKAVTDAKDGKASITFNPGVKAGVATVRATVVSRLPTEAELASAQGAVFLYGLPEDPGALTLTEWKAEAGDQVVKGQELATLVDRAGTVYAVKAPRDGILSVKGVEADEATRLGETLVYVLPPAAE